MENPNPSFISGKSLMYCSGKEWQFTKTSDITRRHGGHIPIISVRKQKDQDVKASLSYMRLCLKTKTVKYIVNMI